MSGKTKPKIYWDTCVFLAWIQEEAPPKRKAGDMEGLERIITLVNRGEMLLFTSVLTHTEVLASKMEDGAKSRYSAVFQRPEIIEIAVDNPIAKLASEIRDFYIQAREKLPAEQREQALKVSTPDAIHLATAIHYGAEEFHTFDGDDEKKRDGLLRLGDNVATYALKVRKPDDKQLGLLNNVPALAGFGTTTESPNTQSLETGGEAEPTQPVDVDAAPLAESSATAAGSTPAVKVPQVLSDSLPGEDPSGKPRRVVIEQSTQANMNPA